MSSHPPLLLTGSSGAYRNVSAHPEGNKCSYTTQSPLNHQISDLEALVLFVHIQDSHALSIAMHLQYVCGFKNALCSICEVVQEREITLFASHSLAEWSITSL